MLFMIEVKKTLVLLCDFVLVLILQIVHARSCEFILESIVVIRLLLKFFLLISCKFKYTL